MSQKRSILKFSGFFLVFLIAISYFGNSKEQDYYNAASKITISPLLKTFNTLSWGQSAKGLPSAFIKQEKSSSQIEQEDDALKDSGAPIETCYLNKGPGNESTSFNVQTVGACFDNDKLMTVVSKLSTAAGIIQAKEQIDSLIKMNGVKDAYTDTGYIWRRTVNGISIESNLISVSDGLYYAEKLQHKHK